MDFAIGKDHTVVAEVINGKVVNTYTTGEWDAIAACIEQIKTALLLTCPPQRTHNNA